MLRKCMLLGAASVLVSALSFAAAPIVPKALPVAHADSGVSQLCTASGDDSLTHGGCVSFTQTDRSNAYAAPECDELSSLEGGYPVIFNVTGNSGTMYGPFTATNKGQCVSTASHYGRL